MTGDHPLNRAESNAALYAYRLRLHREKLGMSQDQIGLEAHVSGKLIGHLENCRRLPSMDLSRRLDALFDLDHYFEELRPLVINEANLPSSFPDYAEQEAQASSIRTYQPLFIPGFLQTESYAREVLRAGTRDARLEQLVAVRMDRQEIFQRDDPPWLVVLLAENALRTVVGGPGVMREQLGHLLEMTRGSNVSIQVIPSTAPVYVSGEFTLLGYEEGGDLGYVEGAGGYSMVLEVPARVHGLGVLFDQIRSAAMTAEDSERFLTTIMESL